MQSPANFSAHSDVLEAPVPESDAARASLLEELKRRGKAAVGSGAWPDASALYAKALQVLPCSDDTNQQQQRAILNANLSLCHAKMHHLDKAVETAQAATEQDPTYVKGWWRLGQAAAACEQLDRAVRALEQAVKLDAGNAALQKELAKNKKALLEQQQQQAKQETEENKKENKNATTTKPTTTVVQQSSSSSATASKKEATKDSNKMDVDDDDEDEEVALFSKSDAVRGYKIVNGKKTSYFHNELSEDAAKLIGDIAPKKLSTSVQQQQPPMATTEAAAQGTSAWNKAGTWGECNYSCYYQNRS